MPELSEDVLGYPRRSLVLFSEVPISMAQEQQYGVRKSEASFREALEGIGGTDRAD
jgi:hypothetical protein